MSQHKRSNYLVDRPFQLKATALIVGLTLLIGIPLGAIILGEATDAVSIGTEAVDIGQAANATNLQAVKEAELLNTRLKFEMQQRLGGDAKKLEELDKANSVETEKVKTRAAAVQAEATKLANQRDALTKKRRALMMGVGGGIAALVIAVCIFGIYFTHKVAGPIHRMRLLFREVGEGKFSPYKPLREGDELQSFFAEFSAMVEALKARQKEEIAHLNEAIDKAAKAGVSDGSLYDLRIVRDAMAKAVEGKPSQMKIEV